MSDYSESELNAIDARAREIGRDVFEHLPDERPSVLDRRWWDDHLMNWSMSDELLKVELFRFVDVLPMLTTSEAVTGHLHEYLSEVKGRMPSSMRVAIGMAKRTPGVRGAVAKAARLAAMDFAKRFIAGTNTKEVIAAAKKQREMGRGFTLDILGEAVTSDREADGYFNSYCELLREISPVVNMWEEVPQIDHGVSGPLPRMNLSIKLSALDSHFDPIDHAGTTRRVAARLRELLRLAGQNGAFINVDMEQYEKKDLTLHIFKTVLDEDEFKSVMDVGIVIQCYLEDADKDLRELGDWAKRRGVPVWVRLVKGAYWDYETIHARYQGWPIPVYQQKWQSDAAFERASRYIMQNHQHLRPAIGSHNIRSIAYAVAAAEHCNVPDAGFELQMLYGMADAEKKVFVERGRRLRVYMPYGELIPGMAYLVRRLLENTSNDSFLKMSFADNVAVEKLLENPADVEQVSGLVRDEAEGSQNSNKPGGMFHDDEKPPMTITSFRNEPPVDFSREDSRAAMEQALEAVQNQLGKHQPLRIGEESFDTSQKLSSHDPSQKDRLIGTTAAATAEHAERCVAVAKSALAEWASTPVTDRAEFLRRVAQIMRDRQFELSAWAVYECGKPWREASGDICEAIDFCEFYAAAGVDLMGQGSVEADHLDAPGENNRLTYLPRGVAAVIAPWNFPLAILTGMTAAALATGNTVIMKPAEQSAIIGAKLMDIFCEARLPAGVVNYLPGRGEEVGAALVEHPDVALIAFTGSRQVGLAINRTAAEVSATGIDSVKQVIAEMGGKNAIIVDDDADLDEAVAGVVKSAFGYAGQKCSACSRAIVLDEVYDGFVERLIEAARSLPVGPAEDPKTIVGPVIDDESFQRISKFIEVGRGEGRELLATDVGMLAEQGYFIGPHVFADIEPSDRIAQEEIFGPVLAILRAANLDEALKIANGTDYALTGGLFSRSPANIDRVMQQFRVGNLYINRNCTGAMVNRQPFGGFRMSGIGSKAGGADYLLQFVVPRTITENTMRRGFAPPEE